jgi:hypothetical protein
MARFSPLVKNQFADVGPSNFGIVRKTHKISNMAPSDLRLGAGRYHGNRFAIEIVPNDVDVLLGRGAKHQCHPGNMIYNGRDEMPSLFPRLVLRWIVQISHTTVTVPWIGRSASRD